MKEVLQRDLRQEATSISSSIHVYGGPINVTSTHPADIPSHVCDTETAIDETITSGLNMKIIQAEKDRKIDVIDADEPETFTLEEFKRIVLEFRRNNKDCILARVSTPDHDRPQILFNNYYVASEVNKLLFKFEKDRRLLHRMKVRNPLNNQYIIGPVHYYRITCGQIDESIVQYFFGDIVNCDDNRNIERSMAEQAGKCKSVMEMHAEHKNNVSQETIARSQNREKPMTEQARKCKSVLEMHAEHKNNVSQETTTRSHDLHKNIRESPWTIIEEVRNGRMEVPQQISKSKKINYRASYFGCDDDFLMRADVREYFRINSMDPSEEFLFELDRTHNDLFALLDATSDSTDEDVVGWKRVLAVHMSVLVTMLGTVILLGGFPVILLITFPLAVLTLISFLCSLLYIMVFRRDTFGSLAVQSIEDEEV